MKLLVCLLLTIVPFVHGLSADDSTALLKELETRGTTGQRRDQIVDALSTRPFSEVGPALARIQSQNKMTVGYNNGSDKPWLEEKKIHEAERIRTAAAAIWRAVVGGVEAGSIGGELSRLAEGAESKSIRYHYLNALFDRHYTPAVRPAMLRLASDDSEDPFISRRAAMILFTHDSPDKHASLLLEANRRFDDPRHGGQGLFRFLQREKAMQRLNAKNQREIVAYGFERLQEYQGDSLKWGYGLAGMLGWWVAVEPPRAGQCPFAPDQRLPGYNPPEGGLTDAFFAQTVQNALDWWDENGEAYMNTGQQDAGGKRD